MSLFIASILEWFKNNQRDLPWRNTRDPYAICVSEYMLQQTQVDRVIPKYFRWLELFPTWQVLAEASTAQVISEWSGLGYNSRALRLQKLARTVISQYQGILPSYEERLLDLPGIGPYTAKALQAFAFEKEVIVIDTNIERIILRYIWAKFEHTREEIEKSLMMIVKDKAAKQHVPFARYFFQALMDFGALVCKAKPQCEVCPLRTSCKAFALQKFEVKRPKQSHFPHSRRYYRGQLLRELKGKQKITIHELTQVDIQKYSWPEIIQSLQKDGLVAVHEEPEKYVTLPE